MMVSILLTWLGTFAASVLMTHLLVKYSVAWGLVDVPNARSSHVVPTPRGGGVAIVISTLTAWLVSISFPANESSLPSFLIPFAAIIALLGFCDDRWNLSAGLRFVVQLICSVAVVGLMGTVPDLNVGGWVLAWGWLGAVVYVLYLVWSLNLFNFMDGIDGIAGTQAVFVSGLAAGTLLARDHNQLWIGLGTIAAASLGFLVFNWPPAKIFMGDAGSGFLGFSLAAIAAVSTKQTDLHVFFWLIANGVFIVDATLTLMVRFLRRERISQPHRSHAYQHAAIRFGSHRVVTLATMTINLLWLAPWACSAVWFPSLGVLFLGIAWLPVAVLCLYFRCGRTT
jgi:Fuc2NAc and GlcNAc transferase